MKMIALQTIHGHKLIREANPRDPKSRAKYQDLIARPGEEFDTDEFGVDDKEARGLIERKAAKRKVREVPDDGAIEDPAAAKANGRADA